MLTPKDRVIMHRLVLHVEDLIDQVLESTPEGATPTIFQTLKHQFLVKTHREFGEVLASTLFSKT